MRPLFCRALAWVLTSIACLSVSAPAAAQDDDTGDERSADDAAADKLFKSGVSDMEAKRFDTACPALRKSYRLDAKPAALFRLAQCEDRWGHIATAALHYDDYLELFDHLSSIEQRDEREHEREASTRRQALEPQLPRITFQLRSSVPAGTRVSRIPQAGGDPVEVGVNVQLPIDPGKHFVITEAPGRPRLDTSFEIGRGEKKVVELDVAPPRPGERQAQFGEPIRPVASLLPPLDPPMPARRVAAYALGGVGVVSVLVGVVTGGLVWGQKGTITEKCSKSGKHVCTPAGEAAADLAYASGIVSTVTFAVGGATLGASAILFLTEPPPPKFGSATEMGSGPAPRRSSAARSSPIQGRLRGLGPSLVPGGASFAMDWVW